MKRILLISIAAIAATTAGAQTNPPKLHINTRWHECSFQLDGSLTQSAWRQFTEEAGLVTYFRPMTDARPMGRGRFEISVLQWKTGIDDADAAWNDTFVHPDSTHYLFEGSGLAFPGLTARAGLGDRTDLGIYVTKNPNANYGFYGAQLQRALLGGVSSKWAIAVRGSFMSLYGPEDLDFTGIGADVFASRTFRVRSWASVSPYAGFSSYIARAHEKSPVVTLRDEVVPGSASTLGASLDLRGARLGAEYSTAAVKSVSMKIGFAF
jgi:hypothetical protein